MNKYKTLLFTLPVLVFLTAAPAYVAALAGQDAVHEHGVQKAPSHGALSPGASSPLLDQPSFKKMMESGWPSAEKNLVLAGLSGEWRYKATFWAVPGAEPHWTTGKIRNEMTLDGRFLSSSFIGSLDVGGNGTMIKGQGLMGYDNAKKSFTSVWVDNLTTGMMIGSGKYDSKTNAINETGQFTNPLTGAEARFRSELRFIGTENYKRTIFAVDKSGKETKLMEFDYSKGL
jgi:hypothetical protein